MVESLSPFDPRILEQGFCVQLVGRLESERRESGVLLCLGREVREHLYGNSLCGCVNRKPQREGGKSPSSASLAKLQVC